MQDRPGALGRESETAPLPMYAAGWYPDPSDAHELRYHNGSEWTADVSDGGVRSVQPLLVPGRRPRSGRAPLVLGIIALSTGWIPFVAFVSIVVAGVAVTLGLRRRRDPSARSAATAGVATGAAGLALSLLGVWLTVAFVGAVLRFEDPGPHDATLVSCAEVDGATEASGTITNRSDRTRSYTVTVSFDDEQTASTTVDDVEPGASAEFTADEDFRFDELDCRIETVNGPRPFGLVVEN